MSGINPATGKDWAIRPDGIWDDNYAAQQKQSSGGGGGAPDYASIAREQMKMMQEANAPIVASLQASIPEQQAKYAQQGQYLQKQVGSLDERYKTLLTSITGARDTAVQNVTTNTSQELGRRGISAESGLFGQTVNKATQPVQQAFAGDVSNLGNSQQSALDSLMNLIQGNTQSGIESDRAVQNAIAQLQAGGAQSGITNALSMFQNQQAMAEAQKERDLKTQIASLPTTATSTDRYKVVGGNIFDTTTQKFISGPKTGTTDNIIPTNNTPIQTKIWTVG